MAAVQAHRVLTERGAVDGQRADAIARVRVRHPAVGACANSYVGFFLLFCCVFYVQRGRDG
jgi:hypothetical protein